MRGKIDFKRLAIAGVSGYLIFMFLVYSGVFRDNSDPMEVTRYYFQCFRNNEGFLTYQVSRYGFFMSRSYHSLYHEHNMSNIEDVNLDLMELKENNALIAAELVYADADIAEARVRLTKKGDIWIIEDVTYENLHNS